MKKSRKLKVPFFLFQLGFAEECPQVNHEVALNKVSGSSFGR
jgi:hypothetical protein